MELYTTFFLWVNIILMKLYVKQGSNDLRSSTKKYEKWEGHWPLKYNICYISYERNAFSFFWEMRTSKGLLRGWINKLVTFWMKHRYLDNRNVLFHNEVSLFSSYVSSIFDPFNWIGFAGFSKKAMISSFHSNIFRTSESENTH